MTQNIRGPSGRVVAAALGTVVFVLAVGLRLPYLDHELRHRPEYDERIFVENALGMVARGDWDHRFYEYPGLLLWMLRVLFVATGAQGAEAYLVARTFLALVAAATAPIVFLVVSRWVSRRAGLVVALMLALSPIDIETVRMFRPDTILAPLLFAVLALDSPGSGKRFVWTAWTVATVATALKFSAALVFAPLLLTAAFRRTRPAQIGAMCLFSLILFATLSPYTFLAGADSITGMRTQIDYHYGPEGPSVGFLVMLGRFIVDSPVRALSLPGIALVAWGALLGMRSRYRWMLPWIVFTTLWMLVFSSTGMRRDRFIVPVLGALCVLAAVGLEDVFTRSRPLAFTAASLALLLPAVSVGRYLSDLATPRAMDQTLSWIEREREVRNVGTTIAELGALDLEGPELVLLRGFRGDGFWASQFDVIVMTGAASPPPGFVLAARFAAAPLYDDVDIAIFRALEPRRFSALDLRGASVVSSAPERDLKLTDGEVSTRWGSETSPAFILITWPEPVIPSRLEVDFGRMPPDRDLRVRLSDDTGKIETESVRSPINEQKGERHGWDQTSRRNSIGFSQLFAWPGRPTRTLRMEVEGPNPLRIGELFVFADADPAYPEPPGSS